MQSMSTVAGAAQFARQAIKKLLLQPNSRERALFPV
jgi:hypothetical protein